MEGARHPAVALQFANVADVNQDDIVAACELDGLLDRHSLDLALGGLAQGLVSGRNGLRHWLVSWNAHAGGLKVAMQADTIGPAKSLEGP
jgi:hypothetical protein